MTGDRYQGDEVLDLFSTHARNRNHFIAQLLFNCLPLNGEATLDVLEFGAGKGEFINRFSDKKEYRTSIVEADVDYRNFLSSKHQSFASIEGISKKFHLIFLIDVLEHLEDDERFLKKFYEKLIPGGRLFIYVPARQELYSSFDKNIGHFRRYGKKELKEKVMKAGFKIVSCRYHEMIGYFASAFHKIVIRKAVPGSISIRMYDRFLVPFSHMLEKWINPPFGKSLYVCAEKGS